MQVISVNNAYAGAGRRVLAWLIDGLVISVAASALGGNFFGWGFGADNNWFNWPPFWVPVLSTAFLAEVMRYFYHAAMEASSFQGSIGKIVMGVKVVDGMGQRLHFSKALLRNLSKIISGLIAGIGYLMIAFDDRKQGLHDKIADTFVVYR